MSRAQICPSYEVGYTTSDPGGQRDPETSTVYINVQEVAPCAGTVYGWQYCSNPTSSEDSLLQVQVSMYHSGDDGSYELVSGSLYSLIVEGDIDSYICRDVFLDPSEYFPIEQGDMVAACWNETDRVELFSFRRRVFNSLVSGGQCSQEVIDETITLNRRALFLQAYISK